MKFKLYSRLLVVFFSISLMVTSVVFAESTSEKKNIKITGLYDIQYRTGDPYNGTGEDKFVIHALYLRWDAELAKNVDSRFFMDGADLAKETTSASHKYVEEAYIRIKKINDIPLTIILGKDEMPYGQDYEKSLFDPLKHELEIDKVWGLSTAYKFDKAHTIQAGIWEQDGTSDISIYENYAVRLVSKKSKKLSSKISYANIKNPGSTDETRVSVGAVYKVSKPVVVYFEYNGFDHPTSTIGGYALGKNPMLLSYGIDYYCCDNWKLKIRNEMLEDDSSSDTLTALFHTGIDYKIAEKTSLMLEYQNEVGEGSNKDVGEVSFGVISKF